MQNEMRMAPDRYRTNVRRRPDGLAQIQAATLPAFSLGTLRTLGLGVVGAALLVAAMIVAPLWLAFGGRPLAQGRAGAGAPHGASVTDLSVRR